MKHYVHTPDWEREHMKIQMKQIEKRQAAIEARREKLDQELAEVKNYFSRIA